MSAAYFKFQDAVRGQSDPMKAVAELAKMLDRQQQLAAIQAAELAAQPQGAFYFNATTGIFGFGVQSARVAAGFSVGSLVYVQRDRNIEKADSLSGKPAGGVVVAQQPNNRVLWAMMAGVDVFIQGDPSEQQPANTQDVWLGLSGFGAYGPPTASGSVAQKVGVRWYLNPTNSRYFCLIDPRELRISL